MTPQEQPDSQAGDELGRKELEQTLEELHRVDDGHTKHRREDGQVGDNVLDCSDFSYEQTQRILTYAERLATEARIDELNKVSNWELPDLYSQPYLESMCDKRIAALTAKADTDEDGDPVQHTTWRKQA